jgi:preprotein translocase subunit SecF
MVSFRLLRKTPRIDFIRRRKYAFVFSLFLVALSVGLFLVKGLDYGIDFRGGILIEVRTEQTADLATMRRSLSSLGLGEVSLQEFGQPNDVLIRVQRQEGGEKAQQAAVETVKKALGPGIEYRRVEFVGPKVSEELFWAGVYAVSLAVLAMLVYIWFRFEWQFGVGAVTALVHDVVTTIGIFAALGLEFNLSTVAAVLTIAGYSINDTVVIYDRVRENLRKYKKLTLAELLNMSLNETLSRTLMTSITTLLALLALFILGGQVIRGFSFAMIFGVIIGTYSSVWIAAPLLLYMNIRRGEREGGKGEAERKAASPAS